MRFVLLSLVALLSLPAFAQADPNEPASYFPMEVGNAWEYEVTLIESGLPLAPLVYRDSLVADTLIGGTQYIVQQRVRIDLTGGVIFAEPLTEALLRFDAAAAHVVERTPSGDEVPYLTPCAFDVAFDAAPFDCGGDSFFDVGFASTAVPIGPRDAPTDQITTSTKAFTRNITDSLTVAAGLGIVREWRCDEACRFRTLRYARVGEAVYGVPRVPGLRVTPDPNPGTSYFPLAIGNAWEYDPFSVFETRYRREVLRDSLIDGVRYVEMKTWYESGDAGPYSTTRLVRYDDQRGIPVGLDQSNPGDVDFALSECRLDTPLYQVRSGSVSAACACTDERTCTPSFLDSGTATVLGTERASKAFLNIGYGIRYAAGLGEIAHFGDPDYSDRLTYARVDGVEYGTAQLEYLTSVSAEDGTSPRSLVLTAYPNPFSETATLQLRLPEATSMTLNVFDVLGRRVQTQPETRVAGDHTLVLNAKAWAPGTYVVRLQTEDGAVRTVRMTKR